MDESQDQKLAVGCPAMLAGQLGHELLGQSELNALCAASLQGSTTITHPYHPLFSQHFVILKSRVVHGVECLVLKGSPSGTFSVPRAWTSNALEDHYSDAGVEPRVLRMEQLLELARLVKLLAD